MKNEPTGEEVAALLSHIHLHGDSIYNKIEYAPSIEASEKQNSKIYYAEEDLLPVLKALGLPEPVWAETMSVEQYLKKKK